MFQGEIKTMNDIIKYGVGFSLAIIGAVVGMTLGAGVVTAVWSTLATNVIGLSTTGNLTFASFFQEGGIVMLLLSTAVVVALIGIPIGAIGIGIAYMKSKGGMR